MLELHRLRAEVQQESFAKSWALLTGVDDRGDPEAVVADELSGRSCSTVGGTVQLEVLHAGGDGARDRDGDALASGGGNSGSGENWGRLTKVIAQRQGVVVRTGGEVGACASGSSSDAETSNARSIGVHGRGANLLTRTEEEVWLEVDRASGRGHFRHVVADSLTAETWLRAELRIELTNESGDHDWLSVELSRRTEVLKSFNSEGLDVVLSEGCTGEVKNDRGGLSAPTLEVLGDELAVGVTFEDLLEQTRHRDGVDRKVSSRAGLCTGGVGEVRVTPVEFALDVFQKVHSSFFCLLSNDVAHRGADESHLVAHFTTLAEEGDPLTVTYVRGVFFLTSATFTDVRRSVRAVTDETAVLLEQVVGFVDAEGRPQLQVFHIEGHDFKGRFQRFRLDHATVGEVGRATSVAVASAESLVQVLDFSLGDETLLQTLHDLIECVLIHILLSPLLLNAVFSCDFLQLGCGSDLCLEDILSRNFLT